MVRRVGIFDSGLGGFSLLKPMFENFPDWEVFYIADQAFGPYGNSSMEIVQERSLKLTEILIAKQVDLIIVACNTATALAIELLRERFKIPFVGIEPYLNIINRYPTLVHCAKGVVLSTAATNQSIRFCKLRSKLDPDSLLDYVGLTNLASIIESAFGSLEHHLLREQVKEELGGVIEKNYDFAILGCTHYPLISQMIESILGVKSYSPGNFVIKHAASILQVGPSKKKSREQFNFLSTLRNEWNSLDYSYIDCLKPS